ncbi:MAG: TRAP transporter small permease [Pseudobutyrivibrio sp.]|nr:TRAP transporter small permease [Pseudobutyrivibrio sp.]
MALLAILVCFAVIMRYFFSISWKELSEFNVTLFAFTTFWGMGINVIKGEHVLIDILYNSFKPGMKKLVNIINFIIMFIVDIVFTVQGFKYVAMAGKQLSMGMEIPMKYMYGIMPISGVICAICIVVKLIEIIVPDDQSDTK